MAGVSLKNKWVNFSILSILFLTLTGAYCCYPTPTEKILGDEIFYLSLIDEKASVLPYELFATIKKDGSLSVNLELYEKARVELIDTEQLILVVSDLSRSKYLCLDGENAIVKDIEETNMPAECKWLVILETKRLIPLENPTAHLQFGNLTKPFFNVILRLKSKAKALPGFSDPDCVQPRVNLTKIAHSEVEDARDTLKQIRSIRETIQNSMPNHYQDINSLIDKFIAISFNITMLGWDHDALQRLKRPKYEGISGRVFTYDPKSSGQFKMFLYLYDELFRLIKDQVTIMRKLHKIFAIQNPNEEIKSLSDLLKEAGILGEDAEDIDGKLYLINRYVPEKYRDGLEEWIPSSETKENAVILKLEEILLKANDWGFIAYVYCYVDWMFEITRFEADLKYLKAKYISKN